MSKIDDGGPCSVSYDQTGMTLRDWFAGQALTGVLSDPNSCADYHLVARSAYGYADAMIVARKDGQGGGT